MINAILKGIFSIIISLVNLLLVPLDTLINSALPSISTGLEYVNNFIDYILNFIPWICSWFNFPQAFLTLLIGYYTFKLTIPLAVSTIKMAIDWYNKLKP